MWPLITTRTNCMVQSESRVLAGFCGKLEGWLVLRRNIWESVCAVSAHTVDLLAPLPFSADKLAGMTFAGNAMLAVKAASYMHGTRARRRARTHRIVDTMCESTHFFLFCSKVSAGLIYILPVVLVSE